MQKHNELEVRNEEFDELSDKKRVIREIADFFDVQEVLNDKNIFDESISPAMHVIFAKNPIISEDKIASLFAQILRENYLIIAGKLYEIENVCLTYNYAKITVQFIKRKHVISKKTLQFIWDEPFSFKKEALRMNYTMNRVLQEIGNAKENMVVVFSEKQGRKYR